MVCRLNKIYLGTNTKMYKTIKGTQEFLSKLSEKTEDINHNEIELFVIPSFTALETARKTVSNNRVKLGAQNMCWEDEGQFTGEISPLMLKEVGIDIIEIGHSERRHVLGETDIEENKKVLAALKHGFTPLLCVGETMDQKKLNISDETLKFQLKVGLNGVTSDQAKNLWIAYEPVWAIGVNGIPADEEYANAKHALIKEILIELFGKEIGKDIPVLYGGSVNNDNASKLIRMKNIDGLFIGRSAWDAENFANIIHEVIPVFKKRISK